MLSCGTSGGRSRASPQACEIGLLFSLFRYKDTLRNYMVSSLCHTIPFWSFADVAS
jgi:hypothetical protein